MNVSLRSADPAVIGDLAAALRNGKFAELAQLAAAVERHAIWLANHPTHAKPGLLRSARAEAQRLARLLAAAKAGIHKAKTDLAAARTLALESGIYQYNGQIDSKFVNFHSYSLLF